MNNPLFRVKISDVNNSKKCACLITGYRGRIASYKKVIDTLNKNGYSVIAYEHTPKVLTGGDPALLLNLVDQICADFAGRSVRYDRAICVGASIGAGLCLAIQRQFPVIGFGIYAGAGVSPPETIFEAPIFYRVRQQFAKHGFDLAALRDAWSEVDIVPNKLVTDTPFIMALGKKDKVVNYQKARTTLESWQNKGQMIRIITQPSVGHLGIIRWYKKHFRELLAEAERFVD